MKLNFKKSFPIFIICLFGIIFHYQHINDYPSHTHSWAQSDRYAISKSFVNNGLNFFEPETYLLNPQFPHFWEVPNEKSITSVDFPIHDYIPAIFMKITGINSPFVVRIYNLLYSLLGLFFLYKIALFYLKNELKSLFVIIFAATSPVFLFYQNSFIPTIPSLSNAIISIYFYSIYISNNKNKAFNLSVIFATLATLSRTTFIIPLVAILCLEFLQILKKKSSLKPKIIPTTISISVIVGYYFYNNYLRSIYGSSFLNTLMNADDFNAFFSKLNQSINNWGTQYFSNIHYYIFTILILFSIVLYILKRLPSNKNIKNFNLLIGIIFIGNFLFLIAMIHQFILHDYYFLDTFYLPVILLLISLLIRVPIPDKKWGRLSIIIIVSGLSILFIKNGIDSQKDRYTYKFWEGGEYLVENYKTACLALDSLGINKDKKVLIFEPYAPNLPLLTLDRKGYSVMANRTSTIEKALTWDFDVIVFQNEEFITQVIPNYPTILNNITRVWGNDKISICRPTKNEYSFNQFFEIDKKKSIIQSSLNKKDTNRIGWSNITPFLLDSNSFLRIKTENGPVFSSKSKELFTKENTLYFEGKIKFPVHHNTKITFSISNENGENLYFKVKDINIKNKEWNTVRFWLNIPLIKEENLEFKLYINNSDKTEINIEKLSLRIFETKT